MKIEEEDFVVDQLVKDLLENTSVAVVGTEKIDGNRANIVEYTTVTPEGTHRIKMWVWDGKGVVLKGEIGDGSGRVFTTISNSNFTFGSISDSIFDVPADQIIDIEILDISDLENLPGFDFSDLPEY